MLRENRSIIRKNRNIFELNNGQFFSLTVFLIVLFLIIFVAVLSKNVYDAEKFNIERLEKTMMNNYVSDFGQIYVLQIIDLSLKPAVAGVLKKEETVSKQRLVEIMDNGEEEYMDPDLAMKKTLRGVIGTAIYSLDYQDTEFVVKLDKVEQVVPDELRFTFLVDYSFRLGDDKWEKKNDEVVVNMKLLSLNHPAYNYTYINSEWIVDDEATECFSNQVFTDAEPCAGLNLRPRTNP